MSKYRVGIVGLTGIASARRRPAQDSPFQNPMPSSHASAYAATPETAVVGACDLKEELMEDFVETWGDVWSDIAKYRDYKDLIASEGLDIISVATSDHRHADIVVDAAEAGVRGIYCEKPMATNLHDADRMIAAVEKNNAVMSINHTRRWSPIWHQARHEIRSGGLGELDRIVATLGSGRAMLFRNGTHLIDMICFFAESDPAVVFAELEDGYEDYWEYKGDGGRDAKTDPSASGYIRFANGVRAFLNASKNISVGFHLDLIGAQGRISVSDSGAEIWKANGMLVGMGAPLIRPAADMKTIELGAVS